MRKPSIRKDRSKWANSRLELTRQEPKLKKRHKRNLIICSMPSTMSIEKSKNLLKSQSKSSLMVVMMIGKRKNGRTQNLWKLCSLLRSLQRITMPHTMVSEPQPSPPSPQLPISTERDNKPRAKLTASIESDSTKIATQTTKANSRKFSNPLKKNLMLDTSKYLSPNQ